MRDCFRIDGQELKDQGARLTNLLKLRTLPFAMKLLPDEKVFVQVPGLRRPREGRRFTLCQLVTQCRISGVTLGVTADSLLSGSNCGAVPGLHALGEEHLSGEMMARVWFGNREAAKAHQEVMYRRTPGRHKALVLSPLRTGRLSDPDVTLFYGTPAQMILFVNGLQWKRYRRLNFTVTGETACADSWGRALVTGEPSLSIPCYGERRYGGVAEDELLMALSPQDLSRGIEGLEGLAKAGLRYPIPPYGIQADPAEGLTRSYGDRPDSK
jgi:uncharacterized protein (DUF169 family)